MTIDEVVGQLQQIGYTANDLLVITGGEPMLQQDRVVQLIYLMNQDVATFVTDRRQVEIETNGTIEPSFELLGLRGVWFNVSPKLQSSLQVRPVHRVTGAIATYANMWRARFKFVISTERDFEEVRELVRHLPYVEKSRIWVMPEGTTAEVIGERLKWLAPMALEYGWNLTTRLHTVIWGSERKR